MNRITWDPAAEPTPEQWLDWLLSHNRDDRLSIAQQAIERGRPASTSSFTEVTRVKRVLKHSVPVDDEWHEIPCEDVLHVACQFDQNSVQVWTLDYGYPQPSTMLVRVFGTGQPLPERSAHLGSVVTADGALVWHLFRGIEL